jgi:hypothetical protein
VQHLRARHMQEENHAKVLAAAGAGGAVAKRRLLRKLDQLGDRFRLHLRIDDKHVGHGADEADRREVPLQIELEVLVDLRRDKKLRSHHQPRVAVGGRSRNDVGAHCAGDARPRVDHDALTPRLVEPFGEEAGDDVRARPWGAADDETNGSLGIGGGRRRMCTNRERERNPDHGKR